jgi:hypothetical protein
MRFGRLRQMTELIDRIEDDLAAVQELITPMQRDDADPWTSPESTRPHNGSVAGPAWEQSAFVQEDSASL